MEDQLTAEIESRRQQEIAKRYQQEKQAKIAELKSIKDARRVKLDKDSSGWEVKAASNNIAFLKNSRTGRSLRVTRGFDLPGCGSVTAIEPAKQKVTAGGCVIK